MDVRGDARGEGILSGIILPVIQPVYNAGVFEVEVMPEVQVWQVTLNGLGILKEGDRLPVQTVFDGDVVAGIEGVADSQGSGGVTPHLHVYILIADLCGLVHEGQRGICRDTGLVIGDRFEETERGICRGCEFKTDDVIAHHDRGYIEADVEMHGGPVAVIVVGDEVRKLILVKPTHDFVDLLLIVGALGEAGILADLDRAGQHVVILGFHVFPALQIGEVGGLKFELIAVGDGLKTGAAVKGNNDAVEIGQTASVVYKISIVQRFSPPPG